MGDDVRPTGPLAGTTVLDLTRNAPGPFCTMILGDLGADVLTIHDPRPPAGRRAEQAGAAPPRPPLRWRGTRQDALGRNKRSILLDLKDTEARELFYRLARTADVLVEEFRPGVTSRLGIDYDTLRALNPRLVYCSVTGYGQDGPYARLAGHDLNYIGQAGLLSLIGRDGRPVIPQNVVADYAGGGLMAALGVLAALIARERTGEGQHVDARDGERRHLPARPVPVRLLRRRRAPRAGALPLQRRVSSVRRLRDEGRQLAHDRLARAVVLRESMPSDRP